MSRASTRATRWVRRGKAALCIVAAAFAVAASATVPAQAAPSPRLNSAPGTDFNANGVRLHATPHLKSKVTGYGYIGHGIEQLSNTATGTDMYICRGNRDYWWNKVRDRKTHVVGWVPQCFINFLPGPVSGAR